MGFGMLLTIKAVASMTQVAQGDRHYDIKIAQFVYAFAVETATADANQGEASSHWNAVTSTIAERIGPPSKFLGCAQGLRTAP